MQRYVSKSSLHCQSAVLLSPRLDVAEAEVVGKMWHEKHLSWMICVVLLIGLEIRDLNATFGQLGHMTPVELRRPRPVEMR